LIIHQYLRNCNESIFSETFLSKELIEYGFKKAIELDSLESCVIYSEYYYNGLISFEEAEGTLLKAINLNDECEAQLELGKLYLVPEYKNEELA
jgi:hypothetical protein